MPSQAKARAALHELRAHKRLIDDAIAKLEAYAATRDRIQQLIPRDQLRAAIELGRQLRSGAEPPRAA